MDEINLIIEDICGHKISYIVQILGVSKNANDFVESGTILVPPSSDQQQLSQAHFYRLNNKLFVILNSYLLYKFHWELRNSCLYRSAWITTVRKLQNDSNDVYVFEVLPEKAYIDHAWGWRLEKLAFERLELENTMSWLSTLGGAFSALGDEMSKCAKIAGRISVAQFRLATRLGDPDTQSRCRLYLALSFTQQGKLQIAKKIIRREYELAKSAPEEIRNERLVKMCLGMWAKLKYTCYLKKTGKLL